MRRTFLGMLVVILSFAALADDAPIQISSVAAYSDPDRIASNIKDECNLPAQQAKAVQRSIETLGIQTEVTEKDEIPQSGKFIQLRIENAYSLGNAFIGHKKQVTTTARLFENGKEINKYTETRSSGGGFGAGFKGSCTVLERCTDALGKDIAKWLKSALAQRNPANSATSTEKSVPESTK